MKTKTLHGFSEEEITLAKKLKEFGYQAKWQPRSGDWVYSDADGKGEVFLLIAIVDTIPYKDKYVWLPQLHQCIEMLQDEYGGQIALTTYCNEVHIFSRMKNAIPLASDGARPSVKGCITPCWE